MTTITANYPRAAFASAFNTSAVAVFLLSVLGFPVSLLLSSPVGILAFPFGIIALRQVNARGERGRGLAIASLVLSATSTLVVVAAVLVAVLGATQYSAGGALPLN